MSLISAFKEHNPPGCHKSLTLFQVSVGFDSSTITEVSIALSSFELEAEFKLVHIKLLSIGEYSKTRLIEIYREDW